MVENEKASCNNGSSKKRNDSHTYRMISVMADGMYGKALTASVKMSESLTSAHAEQSLGAIKRATHEVLL